MNGLFLHEAAAMFASHLGVPRAASAVMSGGAEEPRAGMAPAAAQSAHNCGPGVIMIVPPSCPGSTCPGSTCPGSTARGRDSPGRRPARGRPGVGTHSGSAWPRYDIHYESPGVPDPPRPRASVMNT